MSAEKTITDGTQLDQKLGKLAELLAAANIDPHDSDNLLEEIRAEMAELLHANNTLRVSEERYRFLFDHLDRGAAIYQARDEGGDFVFTGLNRAAEKISSYRQEELIGQSVLELFPLLTAQELVDVYERVWRSGQAEFQSVFEFREGSYRGWIENYVMKLPNDEVAAIFNDVTTRQEAENQLNYQKELLERIIEALDYPFLLINTANYQVEMANPAAKNLSQVAALTTCYALTHRGDQPCMGPDHSCPLELVVQTRKPVILEHKHFDAQGNLYPVEVHGYPLFDEQGYVNNIIEYTLDITDRKRAEQAAQEAATAAERERLAQDLHDAVSQTLFSASLVARLLPDLMDNNPAAAQQNLTKLQQLIDAATAEMRSLLLELRPGELVENDLTYLLRHLSQTLTDRAGVPVDELLEDSCNPPNEIKIPLYRIVQEAFNNVAKHAQADCVTLKLACAAGRLDLHIHDDGRGFNPSLIPHGHYGLRIMAERAEKIGAKFSLTSAPGEGTRIRVVCDEG